MTQVSQPGPCAFLVSVEFSSGRACFARETYRIRAQDMFDAERLGRLRAEESPFHNSRVPELGIAVEVMPADPDYDPSASAGGAVRPLCPACGSDDIVVDANAAWDEAAQSWSLSATCDAQTCQSCWAEGNGFARWVPMAAPKASAQSPCAE